jgi:hypothetical protein
MRWKEKLYERALKRPIDDQTKATIRSEFQRRRDQIPVPAELCWHAAKPELTIRAKGIAFVVNFTHDRMVVDAELSLAAKLFATDENRRHAVRFIESVADDLNL